MSDRNRDDYFDLDNFDDSIDSRDYRRRQAARNNRSGSTGRRPVKKRRGSKRLRNRIVICSLGVLILILLITLISMMLRGCSGGEKEPVSTDTKTKQEQEVSKTSPTSAQTQQNGDPLSASYFMTPVIQDDNSDGIDYGAIYAWKGAGYELFGGSDTSAQTYADTINSLAANLTGINVYSMIVPNHTEFGLPQRFKDGVVHSNSQADNLKAAYAAMGSGVTPVNPYNYLAQHNSEYIYFNSDHHWTGLGAYYAYKAFADTLKLPPLDLASCTEQQIEGFTGSFTNLADGLSVDTVHYWQFPYSVSMDITYEGGSTESYDSPYFDGESGGSIAYGVFIYGDNPLTVMKSSSENAEPNRKIAVVKESYGNAFVPYLTNNFSEVHVMDLRTFRENSDVSISTYCLQNGITDFLFLNGVMSANTQQQLDSITGLFS